MSREFKILKKSPQQFQREAFERRNKAEEEERRKREVADQQKQNQPVMSANTYAGVTANSLEENKVSNPEKVKAEYFKLTSKGEAHYVEAIEYLIRAYGLDASHAEISYEPALKSAYAITEGKVGDSMIPIKIGPPCFDEKQDFGVVCRAIAHELLHTKQKAVDRIADHEERVFSLLRYNYEN